MGNQPSRELLANPPSVRKTTPFTKGRKRISKSSLIQGFIASASRPSSAPRSLPSLGGTWYETSSPLYTGRVAGSIHQHKQQQHQSPKSRNCSRIVQEQPQQPPMPFSPHAAKGLNPQQQMVSQTTTTRRSPSDDSKAAYYVVSTTTYYVTSPASSACSDESTINSSSRESHQQRFSHLIETSSDGTSSGLPENMPIDGTTNAAPVIFQTARKKIEYATVNRRKLISVPGIPYRLACDDEESDRLVVLHFLLKHAFNGNTMAPLKQILRSAANAQKRPQVLDIGCGPGTWTLELATENPETDFIGIDVHPMFPCTIKPSNANFKQCNVLEGLPFPDNSFDFVHVRMMLLCLNQAQGLKLLVEITRVLKPDATVEFLDVEYRIQRPGTISDTLINQKLYHYFEDTFQIRLDAAHHLSNSLTRADCGLVDVYQDHVSIPLGSWGGQLGEAHGQNLVSGFIKALDPTILETVMDQTMSLSEEKAITTILEECQKYQSHLNWHVSYGRKPKSFAKADATLAVPLAAAASPVVVLGDSSATEWDLIKEFAEGYMD